MPPLFGRKEGYLWGMRTIFQRIQRFGAFCGTLSLMATSIAQGPTLIDPIEVVEGTPSDTVMVAEWFVTNASENPMTLFVERNVLQVVETMNLPYVAGEMTVLTSGFVGRAPATLTERLPSAPCRWPLTLGAQGHHRHQCFWC